MIDVFVRVQLYYKDQIRCGMWQTTKARWLVDPNVRLRPIIGTKDIRGVRAEAESLAESDPYIFTDDDVLIVGKDWVKRTVDLVLAEPIYGAVSTLSLVETENTALPCDIQMDGGKLWRQQDIYPMHWVGAPMILRKGLCVDLPEMTIGSECGDIHALMKKLGRDQGLVHPKHRIRHNHLGHGFSSNPNLHWGC